MLANKKSAQTLVFIAFLALITNPTAKSGLKRYKSLPDQTETIIVNPNFVVGFVMNITNKDV